MITIKEDYCSREIYRLLIEKGFNGEIHTTFDEEGYTQPSSTLQMAMKWLREVYNLFIDAYYDCDFGECYKFSIHKLPKGTTLESHNENYSTYEEACEAAIKYCLENLI